MDDRTLLTLRPSAGNDEYLTLGRAIAAQCPAGFAEARLEADFDEQGAALSLHCSPDGGVDIAIDPDPVAKVRLVQLLEQIRAKMRAEDEAPWRKCAVVLRKGGQFQMDVEYAPREGEDNGA